MQKPYRLVRHRGRFAVAFTDANGERKRHSLGLDAVPENQGLGETRAKVFWESYSRCLQPGPDIIGGIVLAYIADREENNVASIQRMRDAWKQIGPHLENMVPEDLTADDIKSYVKTRSNTVRPSTVRYEVALVSQAFKWAERQRILDKTPHIPLPPKSPPRDYYLTRADFLAFLNACHAPHVRLFCILAITTAARSNAILDLTWDRVDFERKQIKLRREDIGPADANGDRRRKGRALVPMNTQCETALLHAREGALTPYVIEWAGAQVKSVKKALQRTSERCGIKASPHVFRHSAGVWMAEAGRPMSEIAQFMGHSNTAVTERVYARFSADYLKKTAAALDW